MDFADSAATHWSRVNPDVDWTPSAVMLRVARIADAIEAQLTPRMRSLGLHSEKEYRTLSVLERTPSGLTPTELSIRLNLTRATTTNVIGRLVESGFVERRQEERDTRSYRAVITDEGTALVRRALVVRNGVRELALSGLSGEERSRLGDLLRHICIQLGDEVDDPAAEFDGDVAPVR